MHTCKRKKVYTFYLSSNHNRIYKAQQANRLSSALERDFQIKFANIGRTAHACTDLQTIKHADLWRNFIKTKTLLSHTNVKPQFFGVFISC